jgi:hypothetical protein
MLKGASGRVDVVPKGGDEQSSKGARISNGPGAFPLGRVDCIVIVRPLEITIPENISVSSGSHIGAGH